jgi:hypothetical protein
MQTFFKPILAVLTFFNTLMDCAIDARKMHTEMLKRHNGF